MPVIDVRPPNGATTYRKRTVLPDSRAEPCARQLLSAARSGPGPEFAYCGRRGRIRDGWGADGTRESHSQRSAIAKVGRGIYSLAASRLAAQRRRQINT